MKIAVEFALVATGGAMGAMARYGIAQISETIFKGDFPFGTLIANVAGCLLIGLLIGSGKADADQAWRLAFGIGFLGALTTFSTFGAETIRSAQAGELGIAFANIAANLVVGLLMVALGWWLGQSVFGTSELS